jgi:RecA-family ATPase
MQTEDGLICSCRSAGCRSPAKHPRNHNGEKGASNDPAQIEEWWQQWPDANIGIATGPSGLVVIDVDGAQGHEQFLRELAPVPETLVAQTGRGFHLYYQGALQSSQAHGEHIDVRGTSGYVVAPGSTHITGVKYEWVNNLPVAPLPQKAKDWVANRGRSGSQRKEVIFAGATGTVLPEAIKRRLAGTGERLSVGDALRKAQLPRYSPWEADRLLSALMAIPANIDGQTWAGYGMALFDLEWIIPSDGALDDIHARHGFEPLHQHGETVDVGLEFWDAWSSTSTGQGGGNGEYKGRNDLEKRWSKFKQNYKGHRVTIASIYAHAKRYGWTDDRIQSATFESAENQNSFFSSQKLQNSFFPSEKLKILRGDELLSTKAPPRRWIIDKWVPAAEVTMLGGDGGMGKTTLALQLSVACITGGDWLGLKVNGCNVLYVSAEDPHDEVHFRLEEIVKHCKIFKEQLAQFKLIDRAGDDSAIALFGKNGQIERTSLFTNIETAAREHNAGCIIFDAVADFFGGNENERREVRAFVGQLRGLAMRLGAAVIFLAHPSVDGIKTGRGYSGSTHWNNAVRSRLYFTDAPADEDKGPPNSDMRVIELAKSNRARRGEKIHMIWLDGSFVVTSAEIPVNLKIETEADERFLECLSKTTKQGINVSPHRSSSYAPTVFAKMPASRGIGKAALERAMNRLIDKGKIRDQPHGPPSKQRHRLVIEQEPAAR